ncbi:trypsin II-P29-like [Spodoptera litura]|uniref:Trypsin II-P29-like n=1 Tax=Spodoptera litura TaxID=69820 RepID=A0A9J7EA82_SPOLT|nr:trypsin II-P29-like [Spodoptera litura]
MKGFAFVLLCVLVAVQGRHTGVEKSGSAAALGDNPWFVHLRIAVSTSGLLNTCAGSLIGNRWVLTAASCISDARFIWVRYGVVDVIRPSLVTENSLTVIHPEYDAASGKNNVALININREVLSTDNISPVSLSGVDAESGSFCAFGASDGKPGEQLNCYEAAISKDEDGFSVSGDFEVSEFDLGAPVVSEGAQVALLTGSAGSFTDIGSYIDWIERSTGVSFNSEAVPAEAVHFV